MIKGRRLKKALVYGAVIATLGSAVLANDFKNSIVNIKFYKAANNLVRINFVTSKPYLSKICVMNKDANKYVILLAETENKMTTNPLTCDFADVLTGINITTHPYISEGCKGYTKIVISTTKPITFSAVSSVAVQNSDATKIATTQNAVELGKALPKQTTKPAQNTTPVQTAPKIAQATTKSAPITTQAPVAKPVQTVPKVNKTEQPVQTSKPTIEATATTKTQTQIKQIAPEKVVQEPIKPIVKFEEATPTVPTKVETPVQEINKEQPKPKKVKAKKQHKPIITPDLIKQIQAQISSSVDNTKANIASLNNDLQEIINLIYLDVDFKKLLLVLSAIGFPLIVIFYIVLANKRLKQKVKKFNDARSVNNQTIMEAEQTDSFQEVLETSEPANVKIPDSISLEQLEGLIGTVEDTDAEIVEEPIEESEPAEVITNISDVIEESTEEPIEEFISENITNEDEFVEEEFIPEGANEGVNEGVNVEVVNTEANVEIPEPQQDITEDVLDDVEEIQEETPVTDIIEEPFEPVVEEVTTEYTEDDIAEDIIENVEEIIEETSITEEIEEVFEEEPIPDNVIPEDTEEFITEDSVEDVEDITETAAAAEEEEEEEEEEESVPNEAEEIFEEPVLEEVATEYTEEDIIENGEDVIEETFEPDGFVDTFNEDAVFDDLITSSENFYEEEVESDTDDEVFEELRTEYETTVDGLRVLAQTTLDNERGFYLVNFENFSSLIGYVKEEIFVLKTFDEFVNNNILLKLAEQISANDARFIVRIGTYKMAVEVTETQMRHIIDL